MELWNIEQQQVPCILPLDWSSIPAIDNMLFIITNITTKIFFFKYINGEFSPNTANSNKTDNTKQVLVHRQTLQAFNMFMFTFEVSV